MMSVHEKRLFVGALAVLMVALAVIAALTITPQIVYATVFSVGAFIGVYLLGWALLAVHGVVTE